MARKKEFDEDELLEKATNLFWRKGYNATSAQDLVDELQINRSSLYNTYSDKKTLFKKALKKYQEQQTKALIDMLSKADDPEKAIKRVFDGLVKESCEDTVARGCFMVNTAVEIAGQDEEIGVLVHANNKSVEDALVTIIEKGQKMGQFSTKNTARAYARFLFGSINALRVIARSGADKNALKDVASITLASLK
ncbi:MAG: TetR/AcrR family transcriptional regulator [Bacteroidetes bacterium]|nr:TetR/AcrR family transcriptional regulator [Bacteroidota bacterium]